MILVFGAGQQACAGRGDWLELLMLLLDVLPGRPGSGAGFSFCVSELLCANVTE